MPDAHFTLYRDGSPHDHSRSQRRCEDLSFLSTPGHDTSAGKGSNLRRSDEENSRVVDEATEYKYSSERSCTRHLFLREAPLQERLSSVARSSQAESTLVWKRDGDGVQDPRFDKRTLSICLIPDLHGTLLSIGDNVNCSIFFVIPYISRLKSSPMCLHSKDGHTLATGRGRS